MEPSNSTSSIFRRIKNIASLDTTEQEGDAESPCSPVKRAFRNSSLTTKSCCMLLALAMVVLVRHLAIEADLRRRSGEAQSQQHASFHRNLKLTSRAESRAGAATGQVHFTKAVCDGQPFVLACPEGQIIQQIVSAFYGRSNSSVCPHADHKRTRNTRCSLPTALDEVSEACIGKPSCRPPDAMKGYSADPCPGTLKYAVASYTCVVSHMHLYKATS